MKPLLQVTNQEAAIAAKDEELKVVKEKLNRREVEFVEVEKRIQQLSEERAVLQEQLQQVIFFRSNFIPLFNWTFATYFEWIVDGFIFD